jgi:predicted HNH restriction endonuclease
VLPARKAIKSALVELLKERGPLEISEVYKLLINRFHLTESDLAKTTKEGKESFFKKEVRWAKKDLVDNGTIKRPAADRRGIWDLTDTAPAVEDLSPILCNSSGELEEQISRISPSTSRPKGQRIPHKTSTTTETYSRDARIAAFVLNEAAGACEACGKPSPFYKDNGKPYLEVHHLRRLADGGSDTVENAIAVCPNCHRELHYGENRDALKVLVYSKVARLMEE